MKLNVIFLILLFISVGFMSVDSYAESSLQCTSLFHEVESQIPRVPKFEDGHNVPLRNVMLKVREYETAIIEFVDGLNPVAESKFIKDDSLKYRNARALEEILDIAKKYEHILTHLVEHSGSMMMSSKIERIPQEKRQEFIQNYKMAYVNYLATYKQLVDQLELFQSQDPASWDNKISREILMDLNNQMGNAHNRF